MSLAGRRCRRAPPHLRCRARGLPPHHAGSSPIGLSGFSPRRDWRRRSGRRYEQGAETDERETHKDARPLGRDIAPWQDKPSGLERLSAERRRREPDKHAPVAQDRRQHQQEQRNAVEDGDRPRPRPTRRRFAADTNSRRRGRSPDQMITNCMKER